MSLQINVRDGEVQEVISDLAKELRVEIEEKNNEFCLQIPRKMGSGFVKAIQFEHGVGVLEFEFVLKDDLVLKHDAGVVHPLKLLFNRESEIHHSFEHLEELHRIDRLENVIVASTPKNNHILKFFADTPVKVFSLEINRKLFEDKIGDFLVDMNSDLMNLFRDLNGTLQFYHKEYYSLEIGKFLEEFTACELTDFMKVVYQEGKAYEILSHQLQQYLDDINDSGIKKIFRQAVVEKVEKAAKIICDELDSMDSIVDLAKRVGLNQNTLQSGFKKLYKTSVNEHVRNVRLEKAKELLEGADMNISEICYKIGINSRSYFSKLFKEKYGQTPKQYRNLMRRKKVI
jgi:AraC-like DNA-binding protein